MEADLYFVFRLVADDLTYQGESHVSFVLKKFPDIGIEICISVLENDERLEKARAIAKNTSLNTPERAELVRQNVVIALLGQFHDVTICCS